MGKPACCLLDLLVRCFFRIDIFAQDLGEACKHGRRRTCSWKWLRSLCLGGATVTLFKYNFTFAPNVSHWRNHVCMVSSSNMTEARATWTCSAETKKCMHQLLCPRRWTEPQQALGLCRCRLRCLCKRALPWDLPAKAGTSSTWSPHMYAWMEFHP